MDALVAVLIVFSVAIGLSAAIYLGDRDFKANSLKAAQEKTRKVRKPSVARVARTIKKAPKNVKLTKK